MPLFPEDLWSGGHFDSEGNIFIYIARKQLPSEIDRQKFHHLVFITWSYEPDVRGMPSSETLDLMRGMETALEQGTEASEAGVKAAQITGNGKREYRYYTTNPSDFMAAFNQDLAGHNEYPLEFELFDDSSWEALQELITPDDPPA